MPSSKLSILFSLRKIHLFQLDIQRALEQDATVFDYDGIYDEMKNTKEGTKMQLSKIIKMTLKICHILYV